MYTLVRVVTGRHVKERFGKSWDNALPKCNYCNVRVPLADEIVLISTGAVRHRAIEFDLWLCGSCARERNLIW